MSRCDWFKFMLSIPRTEPMTKTELFTQWSSLLAYILGGIITVFAPQLWKIIFQLELEGRSEGYLRLLSVGLIEIGFLLTVAARSNHKIYRHQECLTSVLGRLLLVDAMLLMWILRNIMPLSFALSFMALDSSLALITLVIWCQETEGASVTSFFHEIFESLLQCRGLKGGGSIAVIFFLGIPQFFFWLLLAIDPDFAQTMFHLDSFQGYSGGFLVGYFLLVSIHGLYHVVSANNVNHCLSRGFVFYRVFLNVPAFVILFLVDQIERNLFMVLLTADVVYSVIIFISLVREKPLKDDMSIGEETMLTTK